MPISLGPLYNDFQSYVNTFQGGWFRPQTDFQNACNNISNDLWEKWTRQAEKSQEIIDNLAPFLRSQNRTTVPQAASYAKFDPPKDYGRYASARIIVQGADTCIRCAGLVTDADQGACSETDVESQEAVTQKYYENICERQVDKIDDQRWGAVCDHLTHKPTLQNPKITQIDGGFKVAPRSVSVVVLDYYIRPTDAVFGYVKAPGNVQTGAGDQIIFDPKSTPLQWPSTVVNEFLIRLGERYGLFTRDQFMAQASTQQKQLK